MRNYEKKDRACIDGTGNVSQPWEHRYKGRSQFRVLAFLFIPINSTRKALQPSRFSIEYFVIFGRK